MKNLLVMILVFSALFSVLSDLAALADIPQVINYQGKLTDASGQLIEGSYTVAFALFTGLSGGESVWTEEHGAVTVTHGLFHVLLGSVNTDTLGAVFQSYDDLYLEIVIEAETLSPRQRMASVGYAIRAGREIPVGAIQIYAGTAAPAGWLFCQGQAISRAAYARLFAAIGTTYGSGDGSTTFNLPDFKGRIPVGHNNEENEFNVIGKTGGQKTHTLTIAEMPSHTHIQNAHNHGNTGNNHRSHIHSVGSNGLHTQSGSNERKVGFDPGSGPDITGANNQTHYHSVPPATATNQNAGGGSAHNNVQPYITINYLIKYL